VVSIRVLGGSRATKVVSVLDRKRANAAVRLAESWLLDHAFM